MEIQSGEESWVVQQTQNCSFWGDSPQNQIHGKVCGEDALTQQGFTFPNSAQCTEPHTDSMKNLFNRANLGEKMEMMGDFQAANQLSCISISSRGEFGEPKTFPVLIQLLLPFPESAHQHPLGFPDWREEGKCGTAGQGEQLWAPETPSGSGIIWGSGVSPEDAPVPSLWPQCSLRCLLCCLSAPDDSNTINSPEIE